jgi:inositol transport system permease protein
MVERARDRVGAAQDWAGRYALAVALVLVCLALAIRQPSFLTLDNWAIVVRQIAINGILAVGVTFVLLTGGVDLSLGSVLALAGVTAAGFAQPGESPVWVSLLAGLAVGCGCGLINGMAVTWGRVAPFIVTLGMMAVARGLALVVSGGRPVSNLSSEFTWLGGGLVAGFALLSVPVVILAGVAGGAWLFLQHHRAGRQLYAVGGNEAAARAAGLPVVRLKLAAYAACGTLAGLAGVVQAARSTAGQPNAGVAYELDAIAAAVIGGTSLSGGVGTVGGTLLGALFMGVLNNGLDLLGVNAYYQQIIKGVLIVGAVALDRRQRR